MFSKEDYKKLKEYVSGLLLFKNLFIRGLVSVSGCSILLIAVISIGCRNIPLHDNRV